MTEAIPAIAPPGQTGLSGKRGALETVGTLIYTLALIWFFIAVSNLSSFEEDVYFRVVLLATGFSLAGVLVITGYSFRGSLHYTQLVILAITAALTIYSLRDSGILKNSAIFWFFLVPIIFPNQKQASRIRFACDALWIVIFGVVVFQILQIASSGSIFSALFGDSLQSVFSERTWTGLFLGMYGLLYHDRWMQSRSRLDLFRFSSSIFVALLTTSFAVIIGLTVIAVIRIYKRQPLLSSTIAVIAIFFLMFIPIGNISSLDAKLGNRNIAFEDEFYLYRSVGDIIGGFYAPPQFGLDYDQLPGVPTIGVDSFSFPLFILNNFGIVGIVLMFLVAKTALRAGNIGWAAVFAFIVAMIHPIHLQPGFVLLVTLLGVSGSQSFPRPRIAHASGSRAGKRKAVAG